jgi:calcineurin-like phosphoesterase family protein
MIKSLYPIFQKWSATGSVYIISDTHFDDSDCKLMDANWLNPNMAINILKKRVHRNDTLIHLGDVGNPDYIDQLKCYKVLITGNHDVLSKVASHFDEVYDGPLFIADRILLSHEPIYGLEKFCINIHGHDHSGTIYRYNEDLDYITHLNMASNVCNYIPMNLGAMIKNGLLSKVENYHRITIDEATEKKQWKIKPDEIKRIIENQKNMIEHIMPLDWTYIPDPCKTCSNHPANGGNGICNCTLGLPKIT